MAIKEETINYMLEEIHRLKREVRGTDARRAQLAQEVDQIGATVRDMPKSKSMISLLEFMLESDSKREEVFDRLIYCWHEEEEEKDIAEAKVESIVGGTQIGARTEEPSVTIEAGLTDEQLEQTFRQLANKWKDETINLSSMQQMTLRPSYQQIIGLGPRAIPLILNELKSEPDFWFWALRALTRANPVTDNMAGDLSAMTKVWLDWGHEHGYH